MRNATSAKSELVCFSEEAQKDPSAALSSDNQSKSTYPLDYSKSEVLDISVVVVDSGSEDIGSALDVCLVYRDGHVECISGDLSVRRWQAEKELVVGARDGPLSGQDHGVEFAVMTDSEAARKGLLKGREDALAALDNDSLYTSASGKAISLLVLATSSSTKNHKNSRRLHVFALRPRSKDSISSTRQGLQHMLSYDLPHIVNETKQTIGAEYLLQSSNGKLHQRVNGSIVTYDLTGTLPRVMSQLDSRQTGYLSFTRVGPSSLMAIENGCCGIYDIKYSSIQAFIPLPTSIASIGEKRKHDETGSDTSSLHFVSFFSEIGLAVALSRNALVGLQVAGDASTRKKARTQATLLVNSLGKGIGNKAQQTKAFTEWRAKVDELVDNSTVREFEDFLAKELGIKHAPKPEKALTDSSADGVKEDKQETDAESLPEWDFSNLDGLLQKTDRRKALYCLSKIFSRTTSEVSTAESAQSTCPITIAYFPPNVFTWLAVTGYVSASMIQRALRENSNASLSLLNVVPGDVMKAINEFDPEMRLMSEFLNWPVYIEIREIVGGLKSLIQSLDSPPPAAITKAITVGGSPDDATAPGDDNEMAIEEDFREAEEDLDYALRALDSGLAVRSSALRTVFTRLHSFPASTIVSTLRSTLTQHELVFFIQILRIELADGGWTSRYVDAEVQRLADAGTPSDRSIAIISNMLNCAIDAIGTSGWLVGLSSDAEIAADEMLATLRAETSAALEGCHEAESLGTFLRDFERFSNLVRVAERDVLWFKKGKKAGKVDPIRHPGFEVVPKAEDSVLPLGLKVQNNVEKTRVTKGGEVKAKSKSAIGKEISMGVGKYSLERIRV